MKTQGTGVAATAPVKRTGLAYKVGLGVVVAGVAMFASSWLLDGVVFAAVMELLTLLGAPEDRQFLPPDQPGAGGQIIQHFGGAIFACGVCIVSIRLVAELLGLAGKPEFTANLDWAAKLGLGAVGIGTLTIVSTGLSQSILYEIFLYDYGRGAAMVTLGTAGRVGAVFLFGGLAVLILRRPSRRRALLNWADRVGWGKMGCGWINKLGIGLIALALVVGMLGFMDPTTIIAAAGIGILVVGIVPHILAGGRP